MILSVFHPTCKKNVLPLPTNNGRHADEIQKHNHQHNTGHRRGGNVMPMRAQHHATMNKNHEANGLRQRLTIRIGNKSLSFSVADTSTGDGGITFEPYLIKSGISMAANLREALKTAALPEEGFTRALVMVDTPVLMVPVDLFAESEAEELFMHAFTHQEGNTVLYDVIPELHAVAVFAVNKDLKLVIDDNFHDAKFACAMAPVWKNLHRRSFTGTRSKLYGYFHDGRLDIFNFAQNRFKFYNSFDATRAHDALYFLLYVWKQLMLQPEHDEMHIVGNIPDCEWVLNELKNYLKRAYIINPASDFDGAPATKVKGLPYDLMTLYVRGR